MKSQTSGEPRIYVFSRMLLRDETATVTLMASDPFQMAMIHRTFCREFGSLAVLIRTLTPADTTRSRFVGNYLANLISVLHHHHDAEDDMLWPKLHDRAPRYGDTLQRGHAEHAVIASIIERIQAVNPLWARGADPCLAEQLGAAVEELSARAAEHFDHEERDVVPLITQHI